MRRVLHFFMVLGLCLFFSSATFAEFPQVTQRNFTSDDRRLDDPIDVSNQDELTITSFNIRNLAARKRCLKDFEEIVDMVDESDVVLIQEAGLGIYNDPPSEEDEIRLNALVAVLQVNFGNGWVVTMPPVPSGSGGGIETAILAYRTNCPGFELSGDWDGFVDLGDKRDMAVFKLILTKGTQSKEIYVGSVHLTPADPYRGQEMLKVADWLLSQGNNMAIAMGDFNWGYSRTSGVENYKGENKVIELHQEEDLFQLFYHLSYIGGDSGDKLRTNMGFRSKGFFYDQLLMTPNLAGMLADGGSLQEDCGLLAFDLYSGAMRDTINYWRGKREYGLEKFIRYSEIDVEDYQEAYDKSVKAVVDQSADDATFILSDHRPIWMQLKVW